MQHPVGVANSIQIHIQLKGSQFLKSEFRGTMANVLKQLLCHSKRPCFFLCIFANFDESNTSLQNWQVQLILLTMTVSEV